MERNREGADYQEFNFVRVQPLDKLAQVLVERHRDVGGRGVR
jgi:hypothetical protein